MLIHNRLADVLEKIFIKLGTFNKSIFNRTHSYFVENYIVYYDTIEHYESRTEPPTQRKLSYHFNNLILVSALIKAILLMIVTDDWIKINTGEVFFLFLTNYKRLYTYLIFGIIFTIMLKLVTFYYEKNTFVNWSKIVSKSGFNLLKHNQHTLLIMANLAYWAAKIIGTIIFWIISISYLTFNGIAYFNTEFKFNLMILIIFTIQFILCNKIITDIVVCCIMFFFITVIFLKLKQDEIFKSIRLNVLWRNKVQLYNKIQVYNEFTNTVYELSKLMNMMLGMIYVFSPIILSPGIILLNGKANTIFEIYLIKLIKLLIPFVIIIVYYFIHIATSITTVNKSIAKYIYPVFNDKNFSRLNHQVGLNLSYKFGILSDIVIKMKIESFIARLNEEYIGFYCFNLFPMTKVVVFQYAYLFLTAYVLIYDISQ